MKRVLLVTRNLPPLVGGMERLNWHLIEELAGNCDVRVIGPTGSQAHAPSGVSVREVPLRPLWRFLWSARQLATAEARTWQPQLVVAGSGLTAPLAGAAANIAGARCAIYVHGLDVAVRHPIYRALWFPAIRTADRVIANSRPTAAVCREIGVPDERIGIVHPGVDLPAKLAPASQASNSTFREQQQLGDRPLLLSVGRLSERKGLLEFVTRALPRIVAARPDTLLLVVGEAPIQALHARAQTPKRIRQAAADAGVAENLRLLGVITDYHKLGEIYHSADVHVFPVRSIPGDPEGFGMVAVEAAAHGLPTVAFATGGVIDAVAEGRSGYLVPADDYPALATTLLDTLQQRETLRDSCIDFARDFAWPVFGRQIKQQLGLVNP